MAKTPIHFINLSSGIVAIPELTSPFQFIRIQSVACEQKRWRFVLEDLDYTFLMHLALGHECWLHDHTTRGEMPRALSHGVPWIRFALEKLWYGRTIIPYIGEQNVLEYFEECYDRAEMRTLHKVRYFEPFLSGKPITIIPVYGHTAIDGEPDIYRNILLNKASFHKHKEKAGGSGAGVEDPSI